MQRWDGWQQQVVLSLQAHAGHYAEQTDRQTRCREVGQCGCLALGNSKARQDKASERQMIDEDDEREGGGGQQLRIIGPWQNGSDS